VDDEGDSNGRQGRSTGGRMYSISAKTNLEKECSRPGLNRLYKVAIPSEAYGRTISDAGCPGRSRALAAPGMPLVRRGESRACCL
jgi:hypothetical protein